ncbi:Aste57867_9582 [Aphanomyces stellatus]|uniref:Aste57867_9582 protein n=1 Tax=Aphanomyces stellatus TaxID=120398 RepID=A0A485KNB8_9STRA|nr:hypothetical protein As57867_009544 [Aphanomyces stellatus]VFT86461.1 Aste57867_9582 [Aphanomyces stellatus]
MADSATEAQAALEQLGEDSKDFWTPRTIERISAPSPLEFYRNYVSKNIPVIITDAADHWPAMHKWTDAFLVESLGSKQVTVDVTPSGYGDAVHHVQGREVFVMPEERDMTFKEFLDILHDPAFDGIPYLSHQNDSLRVQFPELMPDVDATIAFAAEAFGNDPEAVNLWIGDERAVSTMHKDHYENMYTVVRGRKHFTLLPPSDVAFLYETEFPTGRYVHVASKDTSETLVPSEGHPNWSIRMQEPEDMTPWIPVDPLNPDTTAYPLTKHLVPLEVTVETGETLYLPSLWYHRATQHCETVSVNYWHDMEFDAKYVYYNFVHGVATSLQAKVVGATQDARRHDEGADISRNGAMPPKPEDARRRMSIMPAQSSSTERWPRRNYTKPWLTKVVKPPPSPDCKSPPPPPMPTMSNMASLPLWDTSPPHSSRILVHQILCKASHPKPTVAAVAAPSSCDKRRSMPTSSIPKVHHMDAKAYILDLRREIDCRLMYDVDPTDEEHENNFFDNVDTSVLLHNT